jgi:protein ImuB
MATSELGAALAPLPLELLNLGNNATARLRGLGLATLGDCLRLPRAGLTKRFGGQLLDALDRALGHRPDPRPCFAPPEQFAQTLWLQGEVEQTEALLFAARRLLLELTGFLRGRGAGAHSFTVKLLRNRAPADLITINLVAASRDPAHLTALLRERLSRHTLAAPVHGLAIEAAAFAPLAHDDGDLFASQDKQRPEHWQPLVETLRARLGNDAVHGVEITADHRPEHGWIACTPGEGASLEPAAAPRPVWFFETPLPPPEELMVLAGPERIASGWWEENRSAEDYFVVAAREGERFWARVREGTIEIVGYF